MEKIYGIDLGTTYSCIAYVDEYGKATVVTNEENKPVTPSVVYFETAENVPVGDVAKENLATDPQNVCSTVKRQMGNGDWFFEAHGQQFRAEQISALILQKLAKDASRKLGEDVKNVVITCPAYFGISEREATKTAGKIAGLNVLAVLNEPTAAALSYGLDTNNPETVMIYDLGGGTFDVTIIQVDPGKSINVIATGGDHNLGGKDWDEALRGYLVDKFSQETGLTDDIYNDLEALGDLELKSESAKKSLSKMGKAVSNVVFNGSKAKIEISKEVFDELTKGLLDNTIEKTREMLKEAEKKGITSYDKILLVGGSTRMPQVRERLLVEFPNVLVETFDPDESVAKGAAIYGMNIAGYSINEGGEELSTTGTNGDQSAYAVGGGSKSIEIKNVISKSFGALLTCSDNVERIVNILPKNTNIPICKTLRAGTLVDDQRSVLIAVYENEVSDETVEIELAKELVNDEIKGLPPRLPKDSPIDITFSISEDGLLSVTALDVVGNNKVNLQVQIADAMTQQQIDDAIKVMNGLRVM